ncbi:MAG: recombinase family protein [Halobacteriota archaeon]
MRRKNKHAAREEAATNEHEQHVLARIRAWRAQGTLYRRIAAELDAAGIPAQRGGQWAAMTVCRLHKRAAA